MERELIEIQIGDKLFRAALFSTATAAALLRSLPLKASAITWGDEIYFEVPFHAALEPQASIEVAIGDLAYWPTMPAFCIFFGPTPVSEQDEPRAASPVNVFGRLIDFDVGQLREVGDGEEVMVTEVTM